MRRARDASHGRVGPLTAAIVLLVVLTGCGGDGDDPAAGGNGVRVVVTTSILADVSRAVVGDAGTVTELMRPGTDPHSYEPAASDANTMRDADLVVANGLGLEESLLDVLASVEEEEVPVLRVGDEVDPLPFGASVVSDGQSPDHADTFDPHFWLDPVRMADAVTLLGEELARVAPGQADVFETSAAAYRDEVLTLHEDMRRILGEVPPERRTLVTNHASLGYFADRYDFRIVGTVLPGGSTLGQASAQAVAALAATVEEERIPAIFVETTVPERLARAVSAEVEGFDVEVVTLYTGSLGDPGSEAGTYLAMMRENAERIAGALAP